MNLCGNCTRRLVSSFPHCRHSNTGKRKRFIRRQIYTSHQATADQQDRNILALKESRNQGILYSGFRSARLPATVPTRRSINSMDWSRKERESRQRLDLASRRDSGSGGDAAGAFPSFFPFFCLSHFLLTRLFSAQYCTDLPLHCTDRFTSLVLPSLHLATAAAAVSADAAATSY